jgi:TPR repeat protein
MYSYGKGVKMSYEEARECFLLAAEFNDPMAEFNLGVMSLLGQGGPVDYDEARSWFKRSAEHGNTDALLNLKFLDSD